jgi:uncharacterized protein (DUF608 family)
MTKAELREKIKAMAQKAYAEIKGGKINIIDKFPTLKDVLSDLMTSQYNLFIDDILWVAPRPTTFRINLINGQYFFLIFDSRSWLAQIEGKKYYLLNLPEEENAAEAISRILKYGNPELTKEGEDGGLASEIPPAAPEETPPTEETPPAEA